MPGEFLPPVVTKLEGDVDPLLASIEEAKAAIHSLGREDVSVKVRVNKDSIDKLKADLDAKNGLSDIGNVFGNIGKDAEEAGGGVASFGAKLGALSNYAIPALIAGGIALSPIMLTLGSGLGLFGLAAYKLLPGLEKTSGDLQILKQDFGAFEQSVKPEVVTGFAAAMQLADTGLVGLEPVARAAGAALDGVIADINSDLKDAQWKQFFGFMARTDGPDMQLVGQVFRTWMNDLPVIAEDMQPVATGLLKIVNAAGELVHDSFHPQSNSILGELSKLHAAPNSILGEFEQWVGGENKVKASTTATNAAMAAQVSAASRLSQAINGLLSPLNTAIGDQVTFRQDNASLVTALQASHDAIGDQTSAQRTAAQAMVQSANDAVQLSQAIKTQGGSAAAQIAPLENLRRILEQSGATGSYARQEIAALSRAIDSLHSKQVSITLNGYLTPGAKQVLAAQGIPNTTLIHAHAYASGTSGAAPGWAMVGERGPELMNMRGGETVIPNHALRGYANGVGGGEVNVHAHVYMDGEEVFHGVQKQTWDYNVANGNRGNGGRVSGTMVPR